MSADFAPTAAEPDPRTAVPLSVEKVLIAAVMGAMALITFANVVVRYLSNVSLAFTEEYSIALMVVVALLGTGLATAAGRQIRIGYFVDRLRPPLRRAFELRRCNLELSEFPRLERALHVHIAVALRNGLRLAPQAAAEAAGA